MIAQVTIKGALDIQVCVPAHWTDEQVKEFADGQVQTGTSHGWTIRRAGDPLLVGEPERQACASRPEHVHIMLDA